jgi:cysteine-rich repeat protein
MKAHAIAADLRHLLLAASWVLWTTFSSTPPSEAATPSVKLEPEVLEFLESAEIEPLHVIVLIREDVAQARLGGDVPFTSKAAQAVIHDIQNEILTKLPRGTWTTLHRYRTIPAFSGRGGAEAIRQLARDRRIRSIGPDQKGRVQASTSLPYVGIETYQEIFATDGTGVTVAIFDSGIALDAEDFQDRIILGEVFLNGELSEESAQDEFGHGTFVAGLLAAEGIHMARGVVPGADLLVYRVLDAEGIGWASDWAAAVDHAAAFIDDWPNLRVSNSSFVTLSSYPTCPCDQGALPSWGFLLADAYEHLADLNVINLASAGNAGIAGQMPLPACLPSTLAVGTIHHHAASHWPVLGTYKDDQGSLFPACTDVDVQEDTISCFTNTSECLDILAPGVNLHSLALDGLTTTTKTGTSLSTPIVSGAAALLCAYSPGSTAEAIGEALKESMIQVLTPNVASGVRPRLDLMSAVDTLPNSCGDGVLSAGEDCDDGNDIAGDCCDSFCHLEDDGMPCEDWDPCTAGGSCEGGICMAFPLLCTEESPCAIYECDSGLGKCLPNPTGFDGLACDDGDVCTLADVCQAGQCQGVTLICTTTNPCATYTCVSELGGCTPQPEAFDGLACTDDDPCTASDTCKNAICAGDPLHCDDLNPCTQDSCKSSDGTCNFQSGAMEGSECDDENPCTEADSCQQGICVGAPILCDDDNPCTVDSCDVQSGACAQDLNTLHGTACPHPDLCLGDTFCDMGTCTGSLKVCDDANPCTMDSCDAQSGECVHETEAVDGTPCDDGLYCTQQDSCLVGQCVGGPLRDCPDIEEACLENRCASDLDRCIAEPRPEDSPCGEVTRCEAGVLMAQGRCDALGTCQAFPATACDPYQTCTSESECASSCLNDDDCIPAHLCKDSLCVQGEPRMNVDTDPDSGELDEDNHATNGAVKADSGCHTTGQEYPYGLFIIVIWITLRRRHDYRPLDDRGWTQDLTSV